VLQPFAYRGPRWKLHSVIWVLNSVATFLFLALHVAGRTSSNDIPHRVVLAGTYAMPRARWRTELSFYYVGESGRPFTYVAFGTLRRGDLNGDGTNTNDPIYVPRDAFDSVEILFAGTSDSTGADNSPTAQATRVMLQRAGLEQLLQSTPCLNRQRGRIMARNSCREPWSNTTIASVRQSVPIGGRSVEGQLDVFNVLNRVNFVNYQGVVTSPFFGRPLGASAPRQLQLSARVKF